MRFGLPARQIFARLACALALALAAFGHQPLSLPRTGTLAVAAHPFPDGSHPVICLTDAAGKGDRQQAHRHDCDACRVSSAFFMPAPVCLVETGRIVALAALPLPSAPPLIRAAYSPSAPPQAPPLHA